MDANRLRATVLYSEADRVVGAQLASPTYEPAPEVPPRPTQARPGSNEKVAILAARAAALQPLWVPGDLMARPSATAASQWRNAWLEDLAQSANQEAA